MKREREREGERDRERERERDRETEIQRDRETERQRDRETERQRDRETEREREREREGIEKWKPRFGHNLCHTCPQDNNTHNGILRARIAASPPLSLPTIAASLANHDRRPHQPQALPPAVEPYFRHSPCYMAP
jgi:hypothetical protein